jgi:hypothetical protein
MAITVNWTTRIIYVPKGDLTNISPGIYRLNINDFRLALKDIEDGEGMPFLDTHRHNTTVTIGSLTLARVVEIINGYTVTFEDGQYAVELVGANSNIDTVTNVNQVSIRPSNSAGLVQVSSGSGLSSGQDSTLTAIAALTSRLDAMLEDAGAYDRWLITALEQAPAGGGGGGGLTAAQVWTYSGGDRSLSGAQATAITSAATLAQVQAAGFTTDRHNALIAAEAAARSVASGRHKIDYAASTATQYNADGTVRTVFDLVDSTGNPATSGASAVERIPQ